ncbi:MAG: tetratricopeptide repeat protein [Thermoguttaceae bacterium]|nr:tetratricopeptide repeat protein [Thermoguttaceae bacterium]
MFWLLDKKSANSIARAALALAIASATCVGCRNAPFYRMTSKASQSLPLSRAGIAAYERGDLNLAEEKFEEALKLNDSDVETNRYYGETLWRQGKRRKAMEILTSAAGKNGAIDAESSLYRSLGEKALELDDPDQALAWSNKIIDLTPKSVVGWELRGKAFRRQGRLREALLDFQRAAHFSSDDRGLLREIATLQNELGDYDSALATWQCLERLYPTNKEPAEVFAGIGSAYAGLGLLTEADEAFQIAARYEPNEPAYQLHLAQTALARGDYTRANALYNGAMAMAANDDERRMLGDAYQRRVEELARRSGGYSRLR